MVGNGGGRQFCDRKLNEEARAGRKIVLDLDAAAVLGDDARRDGQAQPGPAVFRRKVREKELVLVLGRDAVPTVRDADFDGVRVRESFCGDVNFPAGRILQRFRGVTIINIAVVTGMAPTKGMGLPFISYGNTALVAMCIMVGIITLLAREA